MRVRGPVDDESDPDAVPYAGKFVDEVSQEQRVRGRGWVVCQSLHFVENPLPELGVQFAAQSAFPSGPKPGT